MGKIAGWKIVKQNTKETVYEHEERIMLGSLPCKHTTVVRVIQRTTKTKTNDAARQVGKNKWRYWSCDIEPPSTKLDYFPQSTGRHSSKQKAHEKAVQWMRKHPRGAPRRRQKKPELHTGGQSKAYAETMWM